MRRYVAGLYGKKVLYFDGVDDYVDVADFAVGGEITIGGLVYIMSIKRWARLLDFGNGASSDNFFIAVSQGESGRPAFHVYVESTAYRANADNVLPLNKWVYIAGVLRDKKLVLYVNGKVWVQVDGPDGVRDIVRENCWIGRSNWSADEYFHGIIALVHIYNRALSETEIHVLMNDAFNLRPASIRDGLVLELIPDTLDCENNKWYDNSGHGNDGTIYGARCITV